MALMACRDEGGRFTPSPVEGHPWQIRAKEAQLSQRLLARIAGKSDNTISRQLRGHFGEVPGYLVALIIAWENMGEDERADWVRQVERELERRERIETRSAET